MPTRNGLFVVLPAVLVAHAEALRKIRSLPNVPIVVCVGDGTSYTQGQLLDLQVRVHAALSGGGRTFDVTTPTIDTGNHVHRPSGEDMIPIIYGDFVQIYLFTANEWVAAKKKRFAHHPLVEVVGFKV